MKLTILNETGDTVLTDASVAKETDRIKHMSSAEIKEEFDRLVKDGYTPVDDKTNRVLTKLNKKTESVTMLYPIIGG